MLIKRVLFLNLKAFSATGGIEKFSRTFLKALSDLQKQGHLSANACSAYDRQCDDRYFELPNYKRFSGNRFRFACYVLLSAYKYDTIILSHIHLSAIAFAVKILFPSKRIILVTHGIEVWRKLSKVQAVILKKADKILAVSHYTKQKLVELHSLNPQKITVLNNSIDPFFIYPKDFTKPDYLQKRYSLTPENRIIFTLTRLSATEKNKGYDLVIKIIAQLKTQFPAIKYVLAGKYDEGEKRRLQDLIEKNCVTQNVVLTGFVEEKEITDHFLLADIFILPSKKEGFGIVFIEAMACGLAVIAGNKDGSTDALQNGDLGMLVDPDNEDETLKALKKSLDEKNSSADIFAKKELQQKVRFCFGFDKYKQDLKKVLG